LDMTFARISRTVGREAVQLQASPSVWAIVLLLRHPAL